MQPHATKDNTIYDVHLVVSLNDLAAGVVTGITFTPGGTVAIGALDAVEANFPCSPHGISNSLEWAGFFDVLLGGEDIDPEAALKVTIDIALGGAVPEGAKIHFDAHGYDTDGGSGDGDYKNPYSHDFTFVVPEPATIALMGSLFAAFGLFAYKRRKTA